MHFKNFCEHSLCKEKYEKYLKKKGIFQNILWCWHF